MDAVVERLLDARLIVKGEDSIEPAHDALVRAWKTLHEWIHAAGRETLILAGRLGPEADEFEQTGDAPAVEQEPQPRRRGARAERGAARLQCQGSGVRSKERRAQPP